MDNALIDQVMCDDDSDEAAEGDQPSSPQICTEAVQEENALDNFLCSSNTKDIVEDDMFRFTSGGSLPSSSETPMTKPDNNNMYLSSESMYNRFYENANVNSLLPNDITFSHPQRPPFQGVYPMSNWMNQQLQQQQQSQQHQQQALDSLCDIDRINCYFGNNNMNNQAQLTYASLFASARERETATAMGGMNNAVAAVNPFMSTSMPGVGFLNPEAVRLTNPCSFNSFVPVHGTVVPLEAREPTHRAKVELFYSLMQNNNPNQ